jgi:flagellar motility protein MotE (MotC chaperone)
MIRTLKSHWVVPLVGCLVYRASTALFLDSSRIGSLITLPAGAAASAADMPSWRFHNPEFDQWLAELRREKEAVSLKEQQLQELQGRLEAERQELTAVTQMVHQLQADFDRNVIRIKDQEQENLKRQSKILAGMSPEGAAGLINEMPDDEAVRILVTMKADEAALVIEAWSKMGRIESKRAAAITERIRRALPPAPPDAKTKPPG